MIIKNICYVYIKFRFYSVKCTDLHTSIHTESTLVSPKTTYLIIKCYLKLYILYSIVCINGMFVQKIERRAVCIPPHTIITIYLRTYVYQKCSILYMNVQRFV